MLCFLISLRKAIEMLKNLVLLSLGIYILFINNMKAMMNNDDKLFKSSHALVNSHFRVLPEEIVLNIGGCLYGKDFQNFTLTCWPIRKILKEYKDFFIPEEKANVIEAIQGTLIEEIPWLILKWSRTERKKSIPLLRSVLPYFEDFEPQKGEKNLKFFRKNFKNYVKTMNLLYGMGDNYILKDFEKLYSKVQTIMNEEIDYEDEQGIYCSHPDIYIFYMKNFSLLCPENRKYLSNNYKYGKEPFKINYSKSLKYSTDVSLPLSNKILNSN